MLELKNIETFYGRIRALKGISISVEEGSIVTLLGANGAGKTTTVRTISGLMKPTSGNISFRGTRINGLSPEQVVKRGISQVPQGRDIFPQMSVMENIEIGAYIRRDKKGIKEDTANMLNYFPILSQREKQLGGTLSGGEQQMLAICRALMSRPTLLLMDEPSLGLAPIIVRQIFEIIKQIKKEGRTILLVEQNAKAALKISNYTYVMETGSISFSGESRAFRENEDIRRSYFGE